MSSRFFFCFFFFNSLSSRPIEIRCCIFCSGHKISLTYNQYPPTDACVETHVNSCTFIRAPTYSIGRRLLSLPTASQTQGCGENEPLLSLPFALPCRPFSPVPVLRNPPSLHSLTSFFWVLISQPHPLLRLSQLSAMAGGCPFAFFVLITFSDRLASGCREIVGLGMRFSPSFFQFPFLLFGTETGGGGRDLPCTANSCWIY